jgi:hypothetical protein
MIRLQHVTEDATCWTASSLSRNQGHLLDSATLPVEYSLLIAKILS